MAEEAIRMQGSMETEPEPVRAGEPMGTVISMESAKPAAESLARQQSFERLQNLKEPEMPAEVDIQVQPQGLEEPQIPVETMERTEESTGGARGFTEPESRGSGAGAVSYERHVREPKNDFDFSSEVHFSEAEFAETGFKESDSDKEKKRIRDFLHLRKNVEGFTREDWILSRIPSEDLMEYLTMEQKKNDMLQKAKEIKEKRIFTTIQIAISMAAIVAVVALLKDNPTVLVNILYITGIVIALWIWRGKQDK